MAIYKKITKLMRVASQLREYMWTHHKEDTMVSYTFNKNRPTPYGKSECCYSNKFPDADIIDGHTFLKDNGVGCDYSYEIY